jgi:GH25 family lysozyme M1 (1,4-beta-N-acetylmuramidase)
MPHPVPQRAHPGIHAEFAHRTRGLTTERLLAAGAEWVPDLSEFNGAVDMAAVRNAGAAGVILRAGFGTVRADSRFAENRAKADAVGLPWLAYWMNYPAYNTAAAEAGVFNAVVGPLPRGRGMAGDFENDGGALPWPTGQAAHDWAAAFLTATGPADYLPPWYCSPSFVAPHGLAGLASTWPWWEAEYGVAQPDTLGLAPVMWQETDSASVAGVSGRCDLSIMLRGSFASLLYGAAPQEDAMTDDQLRAFVALCYAVFLRRWPPDQERDWFVARIKADPGNGLFGFLLGFLQHAEGDPSVIGPDNRDWAPVQAADLEAAIAAIPTGPLPTHVHAVSVSGTSGPPV